MEGKARDAEAIKKAQPERQAAQKLWGGEKSGIARVPRAFPGGPEPHFKIVKKG